MNQTTIHRVNIPGGRLPVWVRAGGPAALVFLHYWGGSHRTYAPVIDRLRTDRTVVSYDYRGWGAARGLPGPYGLDRLADDALDVVHALGLGRYVLVGHSMGGKVAQLVASRRPDGLAGLVLIAPAPPHPAVDTATADALAHAYDSRATVADALRRALTHRPLPADLREQVMADSLAADDAARLAWPRHGITEDITAAVGAINVPAHVLAGRHDRVEPPASLDTHLLPVIPDAHMTVIENTGHLSPLEAPDELATQIDQLAAALLPARS